RGAVSIKTRAGSEARAHRLATYAPGVMFGEMALLAGMRRSADAYAKGDRVVLYALSVERLEEIVRSDPVAGWRLHRNIARELADRVRSTTEALRALE